MGYLNLTAFTLSLKLLICTASSVLDGACLLVGLSNIILQALGGGIAFIHQTNPVALEEKSDEDPSSLLLAYVNGDHEYILFDPYGEQAYEQGIVRGKSLAAFQETGKSCSVFVISIFIHHRM